MLDALAAQGVNYVVAASVQNLTLAVTFPGPIPGLCQAPVCEVAVIDRDVILARSDVFTTVVPLALCTLSEDGCSYQVLVPVVSPIGPIQIKRGFVVDAWVDGDLFRFVNTHLEVRTPNPADPASAFFQAAQAFELISILATLQNPTGSPIIVAGDINSSPDDPIIGTIVPPYVQLVDAGYADVWTLRPGRPPGFTCCQLADLSNPESILSERIDVVFSDAVPVRVRANVVGNDESDKTTPSGLWPSDHAGVVARLEFAP